MPGSATMDPTRTINGSFGEVWHEGKWRMNFNHLEANIEVQKSELRLSGTRKIATKVTGTKGSGTMSGLKVNSDLIAAIGQIMDDKKGEYTTEIISKLADPEAYGYERIRLIGVSFDRVPLANWTAGEVVTEEIPFTFVDYELLDPIVEG
ncbi:MAG: phage tail tube protein [Bacteroidota bacterium]